MTLNTVQNQQAVSFGNQQAVSFGNKRIPIEVGFGSKDFTQVRQTMTKINGNYGLAVSASRLALNEEKDIISIPLSLFLLI